MLNKNPWASVVVCNKIKEGSWINGVYLGGDRTIQIAGSHPKLLSPNCGSVSKPAV